MIKTSIDASKLCLTIPEETTPGDDDDDSSSSSDDENENGMDLRSQTMSFAGSRSYSNILSDASYQVKVNIDESILKDYKILDDYFDDGYNQLK